jgi:hypothetical protein
MMHSSSLQGPYFGSVHRAQERNRLATMFALEPYRDCANRRDRERALTLEPAAAAVADSADGFK